MRVTFTFYQAQVDTLTGPMLIVTDQAGRLRALDWESHRNRMLALLSRQYGSGAVNLIDVDDAGPIGDKLTAYFAGDGEALADIQVETGGTHFQRQVWSALRDIPAGETRSYRQLAAAVGRPTAVRAVGAANGANPISLVVPCHRVVGADKSLTGYAGGLDRKAWLLEHEQPALACAA